MALKDDVLAAQEAVSKVVADVESEDTVTVTGVTIFYSDGSTADVGTVPVVKSDTPDVPAEETDTTVPGTAQGT